MKMLSFEAAVLRYGPIDYASLHWGNALRWIVPCHVDPQYFPNWAVLNTETPVHTISCNKDMLVPLQESLDAVYLRGYGEELKTFDGCYNIRMVRGGKTPSVHSYGLAIDINAATNGLGTKGDMSQELVKCFTDHGFSWGGNFKNRKDPMHLTFAGWE